MICFPNAKINIGLNVLKKREDGYHAIESIFYPVNWCDTLEAMQTKGKGNIKLTNLGIPVGGSAENNLCVKAYNLLHKKYNLPSLTAWLLKCIPMGAGLGGGSADAAFFLRMLNESCSLNLSNEELKSYASQIGSDCAFFIDNKPAFVSGKGDIITPIDLDLSNYYISIIYPHIHIDTKNAYSLVKPVRRPLSLKQEVLSSPITSWKNNIVNDFEEPIFKSYPQLAEIKKYLYKEGAIYASMTGSGSALYGVFEKKPTLSDVFPPCPKGPPVPVRTGIPSCKIWTNPPKKST